jgi:hypothetical protein
VTRKREPSGETAPPAEHADSPAKLPGEAIPSRRPQGADPAASSALDVKRLQRLAGNRAVSDLIHPGQLRLPVVGRAPTSVDSQNPAPAASAPALSARELQQLTISAMRAHLPTLLALSYTAYEGAAAAVKAELLAKKIEESPKADPLKIALALGMAVVPWEALFVEAAGLIVGQVRETLKGAVMSQVIRNNPLPFSPATLSDLGVNAAASAAGMLKTMNLGVVYKGLSGAWQEASKAMVVGSTVLQQTLNFVDAAANEASNRTLLGMLAGMTDEQVAAVWMAHAQPGLRSKFLGDLRARADHFQSILAIQAGKQTTYRRVDAYGRSRWARVRYNTTSANYFFLGWVPPDLASVVEQLGDPTPLPTSSISGHIPDPVVEQNRFVWLDAWGKRRLTKVRGEEGHVIFVEWVPEATWSEAIAQAQHQIGGLVTVSSDEVLNKQRPADAL